VPQPDGYVVTRPHPGSGIGSNLASLAGVVWYAGRLGRSVIVDWRGSAFLKNQAANYFSEFFEQPDRIQGVPIFYAPAPELPDEAPEVGVTQARSYLSTPCPHPVMVIRDYHGLERLDSKGSAEQQFWRLKEFYAAIRPRDFIRREIDRFAAEHFDKAFVIGVNLSSGNGEFDKGQYYAGRVDIDIFSRDAQFLRKVEWAQRLAVRNLPRELRASAKIFFATDAYRMHNLLKRLPRSVTRRTVFPPPGVGRVYSDYNDPGYTDRDAIVDAIVDMFLLARCGALIRNGSVFNAYAQTVTNCFSGNNRHIETLYARYWMRAIAGRLRRMLKRA
jgi:hypothetical protein